MRRSSPWLIPRNHRVEDALNRAMHDGDLAPFERLLGALPVIALPTPFPVFAAAFAVFGVHVAKTIAKGTVDPRLKAELLQGLRELPAHLERLNALEPRIVQWAHRWKDATDVLYLGRGTDYPLALEGALKLKEISYIHAEGYASGEMKHGPIALIDDQVPLIVLAPSGPLFDKTVSNMQEAQARGAQVVLISDAKGIAQAGENTIATIEMPEVHPLIAPLVYAVPVQLLAYHVACVKGTDVDQPRNLAKSVTVE